MRHRGSLHTEKAASRGRFDIRQSCGHRRIHVNSRQRFKGNGQQRQKLHYTGKKQAGPKAGAAAGGSKKGTSTGSCNSCGGKHNCSDCHTGMPHAVAAAKRGTCKPYVAVATVRHGRSLPRGNTPTCWGMGCRTSSHLTKWMPMACTLYMHSKANLPIQLQVSLNGANYTMELDTGASRTIISEATYQKLWDENPPNIQKTTVNIQTYTGEKLEVLGKIAVQLVHKGQEGQGTMLVVKGDGPSLIGRDWLGKMRLDWEEIHSFRHRWGWTRYCKSELLRSRMS